MRKNERLSRAVILQRIQNIEKDWNHNFDVPLTLTNGWSQVSKRTENVVSRHSPRPYRDLFIHAGYLYGQWRALHDVLGSPYGHDAYAFEAAGGWKQ